MRPFIALCTVFILSLTLAAQAHVGNHPSVHDTIAGIMQRLSQEVEPEKLAGLDVEKLLAFMTDEERHILSTEHITFHVNKPVTISVMREAERRETVFWLEERGFKKTGGIVEATKDNFEVWEKNFPAGEIGLGVTSLTGDGDHYFVGIRPQKANDKVKIKDIYPGIHSLGEMKVGERPYVSWDERTLATIPNTLKGSTLLRGDPNKRKTAKLTAIWHMTDYVSTPIPDQITLTWNDDPKTTQCVQWRTSTDVDKSMLRYRAKKRPGTDIASEWTTVIANTKVLESLSTVNDTHVNRHTVTMSPLKPATTYEYQVGTKDIWLPPAEFTTAPDGDKPFKFVYMGDAQNGLDTWGNLVRKAYASEPEAAFYIMAGDLVNRGNERDDWDTFFANAETVYDRRQLVPAIGNHEDQGDQGPWMYLALFDLPQNGPDTITKERAYSFEYSNALFVVLDTNVEPHKQTKWLDEQLAKSDATWKFVVYHHPAYSSGPDRNNREVRELWGSIFDKYHVDVALQGHDHAYLRTWPMKDEKRVDSAKEGTIYIVSVSGTKYYDQGDYDYTEFGMTNVSTYQVLDIRIDGNKMHYRAIDINGDVRDEFTIKK